MRSFEWYFHSSIHPSFEAILWLHSSSGILQLYCILLLSHPQVKITLLRVEMGGGSNFTPPQKIYQPLVAFPIFFSLVFSQTLRVALSIKKYILARVRSKWILLNGECFQTRQGYASKVSRIWRLRQYRGEVVLVFEGW